MTNPQKLYGLINEIYLILDDGDRRLLNEFNLSSTRFYTLVHIGERPGISSSQLSQLLICDKSNATRIIKGLEAEGLVVRRPHESDGRSLRLFLSEAGQKLRDEAIKAHQHNNRMRFMELQPDEQQSLTQGLVKLKQTLRCNLEQLSDSESKVLT
jgi:DNA-binding MarR family transcriptional regulator